MKNDTAPTEETLQDAGGGDCGEGQIRERKENRTAVNGLTQSSCDKSKPGVFGLGDWQDGTINADGTAGDCG